MQCSSLVHGYVKNGGGFTTNAREAHTGMFLSVPCGQCIQCRINRQESWAIRCVHEAKMHDKPPYDLNHFLTITYDDNNVPKDYGLNKAEFNSFIQTLRNMHRKQKIRYYAAGEYGDTGLRPHYHMLLFGLSLPDLTPIDRNKRGEFLYTSEHLQKAWPKGKIYIGNITWQSAKYAAKYTQKIMRTPDDEKLKEHYSRTDGKRTWQVEKEFQCQSKGLGKTFLNKYYREIYPADFVIINGKKKQTPSYYDYALKKIDPDLYDQVMIKRRKQAKENYSYEDQKEIELENDRQAKVLNYKLTRSQQRKQQGIKL